MAFYKAVVPLQIGSLHIWTLHNPPVLVESFPTKCVAVLHIRRILEVLFEASVGPESFTTDWTGTSTCRHYDEPSECENRTSA